jgi:hypothetical protein
LIRKARQGKTGVVPLAFLGEQTRFAELSRDWEPPPAIVPRTRSRRGLD